MLDSVDMRVQHLLVIDNGEGSDLFFSDKFEKVTVLDMPANLGVAGSWNLGIKSFPYAERWFIVSNDVEFEAGSLGMLAQARRDEITLCDAFPYWQAFALGDEAVNDLGLFDESLFPAYFEDDDYMRRAEFVGVNVRRLEVKLNHQNSSTIRSGYEHKNARTFTANQNHYQSKIRNEDYSAGNWSLEIRRANGWE
jgi:GT2 family glycosyltransferase